jgi:hypothetical protein
VTRYNNGRLTTLPYVLYVLYYTYHRVLKIMDLRFFLITGTVQYTCRRAIFTLRDSNDQQTDDSENQSSEKEMNQNRSKDAESDRFRSLS